MKIASVVLLVVFAIIGIVYAVRDLSYFLFRNKKDNSIMFVTPIDKDCDDAEFMLRSAAAKVKWVSRGKNDFVICLDCDMDDSTREICEKICEEYGFAKLISRNEFFEMLK